MSIDDKRLQQLIDYARALSVMAEIGRGNIKDTADILHALEELQALRTFEQAPKPRPKVTPMKKPTPRRVA